MGKPGFELPIDIIVYDKTVEFFDQLMQLLHPFMPFITEEIYHHLKVRKEVADLTITQKNEIITPNPEILKQGVDLKNAITSIRDARNKNNIKLKDSIKLQIETKYQDLYKVFEPILTKQVNAETTSYTLNAEPGSFTLVGNEVKFHIKTNQAINNSAQKEQLLKELEYQKGFLLSVEKKLSNERFVQNAKQQVIDIERKKKADAEANIKAIKESLASLP